MKKTKIIYWIFTGLLVALMVLGSIPDIMSVPDADRLIQSFRLSYLPPTLYWNCQIVRCRWQYLFQAFRESRNGLMPVFVFDLTGAMYSSISVGDPASGWLLFIIRYILIAGSYIYHHKILKSASRHIEQ